MITLTEDVNGQSGLVTAQIKNIDFIEYDRWVNRVKFHSRDKVYYALGSLKYWVDVLNASGYDFMIVDRNNAVNVSNVVLLDSIFKRAYFDIEVNDKLKSGCSLAWKRYEKIAESIMMSNPAVMLV